MFELICAYSFFAVCMFAAARYADVPLFSALVMSILWPIIFVVSVFEKVILK